MTVTYQAPLSMGFLRQEYWSGLLFPSPGDLEGMIRDKGSCPCLCHFHRADIMIGGIECGLEGQGHPSHLYYQTPGSSQVPGERRSASLPQSPRPSPFLCTSFSVQGLEGYPGKRPIQLLQRDIHSPSLLADNTFSKEQQTDPSALWI